MNETALALSGVSKSYGSFAAVSGLTFSVRRGEIYGFLGPNGAGKTTTLRMLLGIIAPDAGTISVLGRESVASVKPRVGYLPEERGLYRKMRAAETIAYFGRLKGMDAKRAMGEARTLLERFGLGAFADTRIEGLSKGMAQKVQILSTIVHGPDLIILDEPFSGLDPVNQQTLEDLIAGEARKGWNDPAVRFVNAAILEALRLSATALHLEPRGERISVSFRVDGVLEARGSIPRRELAAVLLRLEALSDDGPGSRRMEKDAAGILTGRLAAFLGVRHIEGRIFGLPAAEGEAIVVRLTETTRVPLPLERLGFGAATRDALRSAVRRPQGLTIVAGPRESGRTETLYALLAEARRAGGAALTIEGRISHRVAQARQMALDSGDQFSAPALVRAGIAQDCDVILIDSIDDRETARAALDAAMAGIRVLAGMSAPDSFTALARLMDLGASPALVAANVPAIAALRLGRRLCTVCKRSQAATPLMCEALQIDPQSGATLNTPKGCTYCRDTGYKGRVAISEVLTIDSDLADLIGQGATRSEIEGFAEEAGFVRLAQDGIARTMAGETSFDEFVRLFGGA